MLTCIFYSAIDFVHDKRRHELLPETFFAYGDGTALFSLRGTSDVNQGIFLKENGFIDLESVHQL